MCWDWVGVIANDGIWMCKSLAESFGAVIEDELTYGMMI